jgi:hypothetical protein
VTEAVDFPGFVPLARNLEVVGEHIVRVGLIAPEQSRRNERRDDDDAEDRRDDEPQPRRRHGGGQPRRDVISREVRPAKFQHAERDAHDDHPPRDCRAQ